MPRPPSSQKEGRILRLQPAMLNNHFFVVNTMPRTFTDLDGDRVLYDPIGFWNARFKKHEPSGELVDEFIKANGKKDIPDTLAMLLEHWKAKTGSWKRYCTYKPWKPREPARSLTERRAEEYHRQEYQQVTNRDWWEQTLHDQGF